MRRIGFVIPAAVALAFAMPPAAGADTLTAAADAQTSSVQPALRFGQLPAMAVREGAKGALVSYARFDVSALAEGPAVQSAVLRLWVRTVAAPGTIEVLPVLGAWQENAITAGSAPELGAPVALFSVEERHSARFVDVDITGLVRDWATGALENHGLALRGDGAGAVNVTFHTREGFLTTHMPALEVVRAGAAGPDVDAPRAADGVLGPNRIPVGAVMFFDLTTCPQGWTALVEARGRAIVGLNPGGTLRGGWPGGFPGGGLADQMARTIAAVPAHTHTVTNAAEAAHTHPVTVSAESAHTHPVTVTAEASHTHSVDPPAFDTQAGQGTHTHTTDTTGSAHNHQIPTNNGGGASNAVDWFNGTSNPGSIPTIGTGAHTHGVTTTGSAHVHTIDVPNLPASGPGTSHTHAASAAAGSSHTHGATAGAGSSHTHAATASVTGAAAVDVTLPYVQLLACRKD